MKKVIGIYSIFIGISIIGLWLMLLFTNNVPELQTEPLAIYFHLGAEFSMAILSIISGILLIKKFKLGDMMFMLSSGFIMYSVINSSGYYAKDNEWTMVIMFMVILSLSTAFVSRLLKTKPEEK